MLERTEQEELGPRQKAIRRRRWAGIILKVMAEDVVDIDWNREDEYIDAFMKALKQIEEGLAR